jgi:LDH2 family malate/lactate/ureidoglycolate dehydrogenase
MVLDIANTGVARGKIYLAKQKGQPIPEGWAMNAAGAPTTNPAEAIDRDNPADGSAQGYAIALMMDMLSGVLTGSGFGADIAGPYQAERRSRAGQMMIALNIEAIQPLTEFNARVEALIAQIKSVPLAQGFSEVFYPGEIEARNDAKNRREGLLLPEDTLTDLKRVAAEYDLHDMLSF